MPRSVVSRSCFTKIFSCLLISCSVSISAIPTDAQAPAEMMEIHSSGARIEIQFINGVPRVGKDVLIDWVRTCAKAVATYYGQMPVKRLRVKIHNVQGRDVGFSTTGIERGVAEIEVPLGADISKKSLYDDWVLTHEMVHLAFPIVEWKDRWLTEGMATYVEPLARLQIGNVDEKEVWGDLIKNTPKGLPRSEADILPGAKRIDRIYWGGAIFCLVADVEIRKQSRNKFGLQNILSYVAKSRQNIYSDSEPRDALSVALQSDELKASTEVLLRLYDQYSTSAARPKLMSLLNYLGGTRINGEVILDERAPGAAIRKAINNFSPRRGNLDSHVR